jgi:hypothetical protein
MYKLKLSKINYSGSLKKALNSRNGKSIKVNN